MTMKATNTPIGSEMIATSAERRCQRNSAQTSATTTNSSISLRPGCRSPARSARCDRRSCTISTPAGRLACSCASRALTAATVACAFLPERNTITPPATSPSPSRSAMPRRISGPICTIATSASRIGTPFADRERGSSRKSSSVQVSARAHHVLRLGQLDDGAAGFADWPCGGPPTCPAACRRREPRRIDARPDTAGPCRRWSPLRPHSARSSARTSGTSPAARAIARDRAGPLRSTSAYWKIQPTPVASGRAPIWRRPAGEPVPDSDTRARASAPSKDPCRHRTGRRRTNRRRTSSRAPSLHPAPTAWWSRADR